jgi:hypothetical protein
MLMRQAIKDSQIFIRSKKIQMEYDITNSVYPDVETETERLTLKLYMSDEKAIIEKLCEHVIAKEVGTFISELLHSKEYKRSRKNPLIFIVVKSYHKKNMLYEHLYFN